MASRRWLSAITGAWRSHEHARWLLLAALLLVVLIQKIWIGLLTIDLGTDGGFYTNIAQHVRDGHGLVTDISLYHKGFADFPHPTSVYPLWPLVYGWSGKLFGLTWIGVWLPTLLYLTSLVLGYLWARRLFPGPLFPRRFPGLDAGHVFALLLALNVEYFLYTSMPYTEALALVLVLAGLYRFQRLLTRASLLGGLEMGLWLGLMFLVRSQLLVVAMAAGMTLVWAMVWRRERLGFAIMTAGCAVSFVALCLPHYFFMAAHFENASLHNYMRFDLARAQDLMSWFPVYVQTDGLWGYLTDRAYGFLVAFTPFGSFSYHRVFHSFCYGLPVAVVALALGSSRARARAGWSWLQTPQSIGWVFVILLALGGFFSLHTIHKVYFQEWNFARRQGITAAFLFFLALIYLLRHARARWRTIGIFLLVLGTIEGVVKVQQRAWKHTRNARRGMTMMDYHRPLTTWLAARRQERGRLTIAITDNQAQKLAWRTPGVGYHWVYRTSTTRDIEILFEELGVDYLVVTDGLNNRFLRDEAWRAAYLEPVTDGPQGAQVFERARPD